MEGGNRAGAARDPNWVWAEAFIETFAQQLVSGWTKSSSDKGKEARNTDSPRQTKKVSSLRAAQTPRRLYPSGQVSLVPAYYEPPTPKHDIVWDGSMGERKLNVKNFWKHFACFQATDFNRGAVQALEKLGRYRKPLWYDPMLASAAPIMVEHQIEYHREELDDGRGGHVMLDWAHPEEEGTPGADVPTVMVFPGLAGHSDKDYIRSLCTAITDSLGWRACVMNWKGFHDAPIAKGGVFRPDDISDMEVAIEAAHRRHPNDLLFAVGFSAGSNQLVKFLGSRGEHHPVAAGVSVCNGFEYEKHVRRIEETTVGQEVYSRGMTYLHQEYLRKHRDELSQIEGFDLDRALAATKHSELDEALVCSLYGYSDVADYYRAVACRPHIPNVTVPLLCVQAGDDPLFTEGGVKCRDVLPVDELHDNPNVIYFETELGSHLSFIEAEVPGGVSRHEHTFCDRIVDAFLSYAKERVRRRHTF